MSLLISFELCLFQLGNKNGVKTHTQTENLIKKSAKFRLSLLFVECTRKFATNASDANRMGTGKERRKSREKEWNREKTQLKNCSHNYVSCSAFGGHGFAID